MRTSSEGRHSSSRTPVGGLLVLLTLLGLLMAMAPASSASPAEATRLIVTYPEQTSPAAARAAERAAGVSRVSEIAGLRVTVVEVAPGRAAAAQRALSRSRDVEYVEPDGVVVADAVTPDDPDYPAQWGTRTVELPTAWAHTTGHAGVVVAVLDTGVDGTHPDLQGAVLDGWNTRTSTDDTRDANGHGTSVAGVIAARGDNGKGLAGACWSCSILPVTVLGDTMTGSMSDVAAGVVWATDNGADVVNMSLSGPGESRTMEAAVDYARERGVLLVASAGNTGDTGLRYPAAIDGVLSVAASDQADGRYAWSTHGDWVDLAAPGCNRTTMLGGYYGDFCGTSSSAPLVAGAVALLRAYDGGLTEPALLDLATSSNADVGDWVADGRLDIGGAMAQIAVDEGTPSTSSPDADYEPDSEEQPHAAWEAKLSGPSHRVVFDVELGGGPASVTVTGPAGPQITVSLADATGTLAEGSGRGGASLVTDLPAGHYTLTVEGRGGIELEAVNLWPSAD